MQKAGFVYIATNKNRTVIHVGVTSNLKVRTWEHANHEIKNSLTARYNVEYLIYYECYDNVITAIEREKEIKKWNRYKKNPGWDFSNDEIYSEVYSLL